MAGVCRQRRPRRPPRQVYGHVITHRPYTDDVDRHRSTIMTTLTAATSMAAAAAVAASAGGGNCDDVNGPKTMNRQATDTESTTMNNDEQQTMVDG